MVKLMKSILLAESIDDGDDDFDRIEQDDHPQNVRTQLNYSNNNTLTIDFSTRYNRENGEDEIRRSLRARDGFERITRSSIFNITDYDKDSEKEVTETFDFNLEFEPEFSGASGEIAAQSNVQSGNLNLTYNTIQSYSDSNDFRSQFGNNARIELNNDSFDFSSSEITYNNRQATFTKTYGTDTPQSVQDFSSNSNEIDIKAFSGSTEIHPEIQGVTKDPVTTTINNFIEDNFDLIINVKLTNPVSSLTQFLNGRDINVLLNDTSLIIFNKFSNHSIGIISNGSFEKVTAIQGNILQLRWTIPGNEINSSAIIRERINDLFGSSGNYSVNITLGGQSIFVTESSADNQVTKNFGTNLSNTLVPIKYNDNLTVNFNVNNIIVQTFNLNNVNQPESIEFNLSIPKSNLTGITNYISDTKEAFVENISDIIVRQVTRSVNNQFNLDFSNDNQTVTEDSSNVYVKLLWESQNKNGTDSLAFFNFNIGSTTFDIQNAEIVSTEFLKLSSTYNLELSGENIAQDDFDPRIVFQRGVERNPILLNDFKSTSTKVFWRRRGLSYPFIQRSNASLEFRYFAIETTEEDTGDVQTVDNLEDRRAYIYSVVYKWIDGRGFEHRSTQALQKDVLTSQDISESNPIGLRLKCLNLTNKNGVKIELFRTAKDTTVLRKVDDFTNRPNLADISHIDTTPDEQLGEVLLSDTFHPDGGNIIEVFRDSFFVAGFQNFKNKIQFSDLLNFGGSSSIKFQDGNSILAEEEVIALKKMDNYLIIFTEKQIYAWTSGVPQAIEGSINISPINARSIQSTPMGIIFQTEKSGYYILGRGLNLQYVGLSIRDFNDKVCVTSSINKNNQEVLFFNSDNTTLVYNYIFQKWSSLTGSSESSIVHKDDIYTLSLKNQNSSSLYKFNSDEVSSSFRGVMETGWIQLSKLQNYQKIKSFYILGKFKGLQDLCVYISYDFNEYVSQFIRADKDQFKEAIPRPSLGEESLDYGTNRTNWGEESFDDIKQFRFLVTQQKCSAIKIRVCPYAEFAELSSLTFQLKLLGDPARVSPQQQFSQGAVSQGQGGQN